MGDLGSIRMDSTTRDGTKKTERLYWQGTKRGMRRIRRRSLLTKKHIGRSTRMSGEKGESTTSQRTRHILFYRDRKAICTKCGGLVTTLKSDDIILHCIDCDTYYKTVGFGQADAELECEEVTMGC